MIDFNPATDRMTEGLLQRLVADWVPWWRHVVVPNLCLWHEMDVAVLTRNGCLWEFEIKISQADWEADKRKDVVPPLDPIFAGRPDGEEPGQRGFYERIYCRPTRDLSHVERFHYVYAEGLRCPDWVPEWAGLLEAQVMPKAGRLGLHQVRRAKARKAEKPSEAHRRKLYEAVYHRYWRQVKRLPAPDHVDAPLESAG